MVTLSNISVSSTAEYLIGMGLLITSSVQVLTFPSLGGCPPMYIYLVCWCGESHGIFDLLFVFFYIDGCVSEERGVSCLGDHRSVNVESVHFGNRLRTVANFLDSSASHRHIFDEMSAIDINESGPVVWIEGCVDCSFKGILQGVIFVVVNL